LSVLPDMNALHVCLTPPDRPIVSALAVVPLLARKTKQLTPFTDTPNSKPRLAPPNRVT